MTEEREPDGFKITAEENIISARFNARTALRKLPSEQALQEFSRTLLIASRNGVLATFSAMHPAMQKAVVNWHDTDPDSAGPTPLMEAAGRGHVEIVKHLLKIGADVSLVNDTGHAAISCAAISGKCEVIDLLLKAGADVNHRSTRGWTPLMEAALNNRPEAVKLLLDSGADTRVPTPNGGSIRTEARQKGFEAIAQLIDDAEKQRGADAAQNLVEKGTAETITVSRPLKLKNKPV